MLTLQPAFTSEERQELLRQIAFEEPAKPRRLERAVPAELETIVLKAMEKRPQDRYATAQELANDLRHWLDDRPIRARRPSWIQVGRKWARRHQAVVRTTSLLLVAFLAFGVGFSLWWVRQQMAAETEARTTFDEAVRLQKDERWSEALSAIHHAQAVLRGFGTNIAFQRQIEELGKDLEMAQRLGEALLQFNDLKDQDHDGDGCIAAYREVFAWYGLDVEQGNASTTAQYIRSRSIPMQLVAALDHWASLQRWWRGQEWKHLLAVARAADFDEVRNRLRYAWECGDDKAIRDLLASAEVDKLLPIVVNLLGQSLSNQENVFSEQAASALRRAQQRHPADFWINHHLAYLLFRKVKPPQLEEAIRHFMIAVALRPQSPAAHNNLGTVLQDKGHLDEAIAEYREAIRLKKDYAAAHYNLGTVFQDKGRLDEAIAESREAIRLKKDFAAAHSTLGIALAAKGRLDEAIAEYREAIRLKKDSAHPHNNLGNALREKGQLDEAIAEYREAIRLKKDYAEAHNNLGGVLTEKGRLDEAITEYHEAMRLKKDYAEAHANLATAYGEKGQLDEAIVECREAIRLMKDSPNDLALAHSSLSVLLHKKGRLDEAIAEAREAVRLNKHDALCHYNLGVVFEAKGQLNESIDEYREAIRVNKDDTLAHNHLENALALKETLSKLEAILSGKAKAGNPAEQITLAWVCQQPYKRLYAAAARFYSDAFAAQPNLADDLNTQHRYNAACAAALAGCGQGADADKLDSNQRNRLRQLALDWLRADLKVYQQMIEKSADKALPPSLRAMLLHWLQDGDFAGVRGDKALAKLPEEERSAWRKLWADVAEMLAKAQGNNPAAKKPNTK